MLTCKLEKMDAGRETSLCLPCTCKERKHHQQTCTFKKKQNQKNNNKKNTNQPRYYSKPVYTHSLMLFFVRIKNCFSLYSTCSKHTRAGILQNFKVSIETYWKVAFSKWKTDNTYYCHYVIMNLIVSSYSCPIGCHSTENIGRRCIFRVASLLSGLMSR